MNRLLPRVVTRDVYFSRFILVDAGGNLPSLAVSLTKIVAVPPTQSSNGGRDERTHPVGTYTAYYTNEKGVWLRKKTY